MNADIVAAGGEELAASWFEDHGWEVRDRNWTREIGEIDLVVTRWEPWGAAQVLLVAFVEVKTRERSRGPVPEVRVNHAKRRKLVTLAKLYLAQHDLKRCVARFDVVGVDLDRGHVRHYPSAFDASGRLR